jgi:hypothetical protein
MLVTNSEIPVTIKLANGETIMGKVLESRISGPASPFGRACLLLEDVATFQTGRHPQKPSEIVYNLVQWQTQECYIPWDKVLSFSISSEVAQDYYRQVFQRVQVADINEIAAVQRKGPGEKVVIET